MPITLTGPHLGTSAVCTPILRTLPDWFGIEDAIVHYSTEIEHLPTWLAQEAESTVGFLSLKQHNKYAAEIYVMGIRAEAHRKGVGRALLEAAQTELRRAGVEYLQVKTLSDSHPDPFYARTRAFYLAMSFRPIEEFRHLWGEQNPCLLFIKHL